MKILSKEIREEVLDLKGLLLILCLLYIIFANTCGTYFTAGGTKDKIDTVHQSSDTAYITKIDSFIDTNTVYKTLPPDTVKTVKYIDSSTSHHIVRSTYNDSLLDIDVSTELKGEFIDQELNYELSSIEKTIHRKDTVKIRDSIHTERTTTKDPWKLGIGGEIEGSKTYFDFAPTVSLEKGNIQVKYEYNILNKTHEVGLIKKFDL